MIARLIRLTVAALLACLAVVGLTACSGSTDTTGSAASSGSPESPGGRELGVDEFASELQKPGTVILDVRTIAEYAEGHLDGAMLLDLQAGDFEAQVAKLDKTVPYAIYCRSGNRSGTAMSIMSDAGFTDVYHLGGGINAWTAAGRPVTTS